MRVKKQNISVIIPMYNASDTIRKTLDSIKYQTKLEYILEVIIIDDGSTDDSLEILKEYEDTFDLTMTLWSIDDFGGWDQAYKDYFDDDAWFDEIYNY